MTEKLGQTIAATKTISICVAIDTAWYDNPVRIPRHFNPINNTIFNRSRIKEKTMKHRFAFVVISVFLFVTMACNLQATGRQQPSLFTTTPNMTMTALLAQVSLVL
jgi:hypothetical protein